MNEYAGWENCPEPATVLAELPDVHKALAAADMFEALEYACNELCEINPSNYDHDDVCRMNDASVNVILAIEPILKKAKGKS